LFLSLAPAIFLAIASVGLHVAGFALPSPLLSVAGVVGAAGLALGSVALPLASAGLASGCVSGVDALAAGLCMLGLSMRQSFVVQSERHQHQNPNIEPEKHTQYLLVDSGEGKLKMSGRRVVRIL
jgi:hypothetical protein